MEEDSIIAFWRIKVVHLVFSYKENGILFDGIAIKIDKVLPLAIGKPDDLIKTMYVWPDSVDCIGLQVLVYSVNTEGDFFRSIFM